MALAENGGLRKIMADYGKEQQAGVIT